VAAFILAAVAAFVPVRRGQDTIGPGDCGSMHDVCIPTLRATQVIEALEAEGYRCVEERSDSHRCLLVIADTNYEVSLSTMGGQILSMYATVQAPKGRQSSNTSMSFVSWLATLPYAHDKAFSEQIKAWVSKEFATNNTKATANVGGYRYELERFSGGGENLRMSVEASRR
jgi:hypothetical protein